MNASGTPSASVDPPEADAPVHTLRWLAIGAGLFVTLAAGVWADITYGWVEPAFDAAAHQFYEIPVLAKLRRPTQISLVRAHLPILVVLVGAAVVARPWLGKHAWRCCQVFCLGYAIRAGFWMCGGNLPLVPGDSCHYLEVASSIARGEGPVKHYVESFFIDYPAIREGRGALDDWATPLYSALLAVVYNVLGVVPGKSLEMTVGVAKGLSFLLSLLTLPALYLFARRRYGRHVGLGAMALLAILPVHALYAGLELRESLTALTSLLAVWALTEAWDEATRPAMRWVWAIVGGVLGGLAILSRITALALMAAAALYALVVHFRRMRAPMLAWGLALAVVIAPWAWATFREYGRPFYSYTNYYPYNFSWTVHHYEKGNTSAAQFYTWANAAEILRIKIKSLLIMAVYCTMILGLPLALGVLRRLRSPAPSSSTGSRDADRLAAAAVVVFMAATLVQIADITQVTQLARYYLPVFVLAVPPAAAGLAEWLRANVVPRALPWLAAALVALLWADPTWAYDASWFVKPYQLHLPALREAGEWVREHPDAVPADARIMTWFPWEFRVLSDRTTVLMPRNYSPARIAEVIRQYRVTHLLWGSFEPPPNIDPDLWVAHLQRVRSALAIDEDHALFVSNPRLPYPVRLLRIRGGR